MTASSDDECLDRADPAWFAELERRARRALANPQGGDAWEVVKRRIEARLAHRK